jgi:hypothetical protein
MTTPEQNQTLRDCEERLMQATIAYAERAEAWDLIAEQMAKADRGGFSDPNHRARERWLGAVNNTLLDAYTDWMGAARKAGL